MRLFLIIFLIVLASIGIGISGAAPPLPKDKRRTNGEPVQEELVEETRDKVKQNKAIKS
ncbi:MAG: hypothetical protein IPJ74_23960 [Saprospiraceae bacterium]|nr:hypothetical protein [Saprospiraceae bacterium]